MEIDLCGHATLAAALIIYKELAFDQLKPITFETWHAGLLTVKVKNNNYWLDFPTRAYEMISGPGDEDSLNVANALNLQGIEFELTVHKATDWLVELPSEQKLR